MGTARDWLCCREIEAVDVLRTTQEVECIMTHPGFQSGSMGTANSILCLLVQSYSSMERCHNSVSSTGIWSIYKY